MLWTHSNKMRKSDVIITKIMLIAQKAKKYIVAEPAIAKA